MPRDLDTKLWGKHGWKFLYGLAEVLDANPAFKKKDDHAQRIKTAFYILGQLLPCKKCRKHFDEWFFQCDLSNYVQKENGMMLWLNQYEHALENMQNEKREQKAVPSASDDVSGSLFSSSNTSASAACASSAVTVTSSSKSKYICSSYQEWEEESFQFFFIVLYSLADSPIRFKYFTYFWDTLVPYFFPAHSWFHYIHEQLKQQTKPFETLGALRRFFYQSFKKMNHKAKCLSWCKEVHLTMKNTDVHMCTSTCQRSS